jgi:hypothetical protein
MTEPKPEETPNEPKTIEAWIESKKIDKMSAAMARAYHAWPIGLVMDEAKFDACVEKATSDALGGMPRETLRESKARHVAEAKAKTAKAPALADAPKGAGKE